MNMSEFLHTESVSQFWGHLMHRSPRSIVPDSELQELSDLINKKPYTGCKVTVPQVLKRLFTIKSYKTCENVVKHE